MRPQNRPEPNGPSVSLYGPENGDGGVSATEITSPSASPYPLARVVASRLAAPTALGSARSTALATARRMLVLSWRSVGRTTAVPVPMAVTVGCAGDWRSEERRVGKEC